MVFGLGTPCLQKVPWPKSNFWIHFNKRRMQEGDVPQLLGWVGTSIRPLGPEHLTHRESYAICWALILGDLPGMPGPRVYRRPQNNRDPGSHVYPGSSTRPPSRPGGRVYSGFKPAEEAPIKGIPKCFGGQVCFCWPGVPRPKDDTFL